MPLRPTLTLAAPGALAVLPAAAALALAPDSPALAQAAAGYPYAALAAVALLAWRFQRSRIAAAALALALAHRLVAAGPPEAAHLTVALLAPLLAILAATSDRRLGAPRGLLQLAAPAALAAGAALLHAADPARLAAWTEIPLIASLHPAPAGIPQPAAASALLGLAALAALALRRGRALEAGLLWTALAGTLAAAAAPPASGLWTLAAALALAVALVEAAYALAYRDELTDLPGRRALAGQFANLRPPYAIAIVDVDHFKRFNDRHGHDVGDQVLRMVAAKLGNVGGGGRAYRTGGEEFTLVFPGATRDEALPHLEALRQGVAATPFAVRRPLRPRQAKGAARRGRGAAAGRTLRVTISVGVAAGGGRAATAEQVVKSADRAMYRAKQQGRNRVMA